MIKKLIMQNRAILREKERLMEKHDRLDERLKRLPEIDGLVMTSHDDGLYLPGTVHVPMYAPRKATNIYVELDRVNKRLKEIDAEFQRLDKKAAEISDEQVRYMTRAMMDGLTQKDIASAMNVTQSVISKMIHRYEQGGMSKDVDLHSI